MIDKNGNTFGVGAQVRWVKHDIIGKVVGAGKTVHVSFNGGRYRRIPSNDLEFVTSGEVYCI